MEYRKDIQILRGIAVLLVVLFHLEMGGFAAGFLGVDVFFVISGYLMAMMYNPDRKREFFASRAKRLLPAYFAVVLVTLAICVVRTTPNDFNQVVQQALFATAFMPNVGFWLENSYFDKAAFKPLLHLWSLGVEIQFYLLVPLLFGLFARLRGSFLILIVGSMGACFFMLDLSPKTSFFWLPFRLWEFVLGYAVATHVPWPNTTNASPRKWLGGISLGILVCIPILELDGTAFGFWKGHPGIHALAICMATAVVLGTGLPPKIESLRMATFLENLGRYSYSIYLAHFPVIVLFLYQPFEGTTLKSEGIGATLALATLICLASWVLYQFVEKPLRSGKHIYRRVTGLILATVALCPAGIAVQKSIVPEREMLIYQAWADRSEYRCGKIKRLLHPGELSCEINGPLNKTAHRILLVGDSHADSIKSTFAAVAQSQNVSVRFMVENNPLSETGTSPSRLIDEAKSKNVDAIVLHYSPGGISAATIGRLVALAKDHDIKVTFILPVPVWQEHVPKVLWKNMKLQTPLPSLDSANYIESNAPLIAGVSKIDLKNFRIYQTADNFCQKICTMADENGRPLYFDRGHLTLTGSELLRTTFEQMLFTFTSMEAR